MKTYSVGIVNNSNIIFPSCSCSSTSFLIMVTVISASDLPRLGRPLEEREGGGGRMIASACKLIRGVELFKFLGDLCSVRW